MTTSPTPGGATKEQFVLRLPAGMRDKLKTVAIANRRSMNAELLLLIEQGLNAGGCGSATRVLEEKGANMA